MSADKPQTEGLEEQLSALPPKERMQEALGNKQLEVRELFYNVFPGCPTDFTRFTFLPKGQLEQQEGAWKEMGGLAPVFSQRNFVANANVGSVTAEEMEQYLTEDHKKVLGLIRQKRNGVQDRIMKTKNMIHSIARSFSWFGKKLWRRSQMAGLQETFDALGDLYFKANHVWQELEPAVYKNAVGAGNEVTEEMVNEKFGNLEREVAAKEAALQKLTGTVPPAGEDIEEGE